ncbi:MAG: hypothetical protein KIS66_10340 [Fimbriimonadaceae bacterium]|nr:hypothetical protein [Fimbriimonadaceae bacterium]
MIPLEPTDAETARRDEVLARLRDFVARGERILVPPPNPDLPPHLAALGSVDPSTPFAGSVGPFVYQFEGEDDLLHLLVATADGGTLAMEEAQPVVSFLVPMVPPSLMWVKPGVRSQHFYFGHEAILDPPD